MVLALRVVEHNSRVFRRTWRSAVASLVMPFLFLGAMGLGLGTLITRQHGLVDGVSYTAFLGPGLVAAGAMQQGTGLAAWPLMGKIRWNWQYLAMLASPLGIDQLVIGELLWIGVRVAMNSTAFLIAMVVFGAVQSPWAVLVVPAGALTGLAFAAPVAALTGAVKSDIWFVCLFRLGITPLFLLGGAFFPVTQLPAPLQWVAWVTPLFHGVALSRSLALGRVEPLPALIAVLVLLAYVAAGLLLARFTFRRQLAA